MTANAHQPSATKKSNTIEKFTGSFTKESSGCLILFNKTVQSIKHLETLGLYCFLASMPNDWQINPRHLMNAFGHCKDKTYKLLNNLIELKLLSCHEIREQGKFKGNQYVLHLTPYTDSPCPEKQDTATPCPEIPHPENQDTVSLLLQSIDKNKKHIPPIIPLEQKLNSTEPPKPERHAARDICSTKRPAAKSCLTVEELEQDNPHGIPRDMLEAWLVMRKAKRSPVTKLAWSILTNELARIAAKGIMSAYDAFQEMVNRCWLTVKSDWLQKPKTSQGKKEPLNHKDSSWFDTFSMDPFAHIPSTAKGLI